MYASTWLITKTSDIDGEENGRPKMQRTQSLDMDELAI